MAGHKAFERLQGASRIIDIQPKSTCHDKEWKEGKIIQSGFPVEQTTWVCLPLI